MGPLTENIARKILDVTLEVKYAYFNVFYNLNVFYVSRQQRSIFYK